MARLVIHRFLTLWLAIALAANAAAAEVPVHLDSERAMLEALIVRLEQAQWLASSYLVSGSHRQLQHLARVESRLRRQQVEQLRGQLRRWYGIEPALTFTQPGVSTPRAFALAFQINHGQIAELAELSHGLKLRGELRRFIDDLARDSLAEVVYLSRITKKEFP